MVYLGALSSTMMKSSKTKLIGIILSSEIDSSVIKGKSEKFM